MSSNIASLVPRKVVASKGCVETLKNMLALAEDGTLSGVAVAAVDNQGYSHSAYEAGENIGMLIGSVERVKFRLLNHQNES